MDPRKQREQREQREQRKQRKQRKRTPLAIDRTWIFCAAQSTGDRADIL
jgi:hypothetical protein